jgi:hypothetical protein
MSIWQIVVKNGKKVINFFRTGLCEFSITYPQLSEFLQMTLIYLFGVVDLGYALLTGILSLGYIPEVFEPYVPFLAGFLDVPLLKLWSSPEKIFFLSYVVIEFLVVRRIFKFSKLVKYNILLVFALLMLQSLILSYWDLLFHREIIEQPGVDVLSFTDQNLAVIFFSYTFIVFFVSYGYFYSFAIQGKFPKNKQLIWLTDSIAFWLRIQTPTMRDNEDDEDNEIEQPDPDPDNDEEPDN